MSKDDFIEFPFLAITEKTFERQGWEKIRESEESESDEAPYTYYYWILHLPKDNPDENCPVLISTTNDSYKELGLKKGEYLVELENYYSLGQCGTEEELQILYQALTGQPIE